VVTSLEYRLHPVGPLVFAGPVFYAGASAGQVLRGWRDLTAAMPDELTTLANILVAPPVPFLPEAAHGQLVVAILGVHAGSVEDGAKAAQPLRTLAEPLADLMGPMPYTIMQSLLDPLWQAGAQNYFTSALLDRLDDDAIDTLLAQHAAGQAPVRELHLHHGGGAMARVPTAATAFAHRNAPYILNIIARSPDRAGFEEHAGWARATHQAMNPWSSGGAYVNFTLRPWGGQGAGVLPARHLRPPGGGEGPVRPDQPVPAQPEHPPLRPPLIDGKPAVGMWAPDPAGRRAAHPTSRSGAGSRADGAPWSGAPRRLARRQRCAVVTPGVVGRGADHRSSGGGAAAGSHQPGSGSTSGCRWSRCWRSSSGLAAR